MRQKVNELLFLPVENRYATNIYQGEVYPATPHAQAWALAHRIVPPDQVDQVAATLLQILSPDSRQPNPDIYGMYWVLEALGKSDHIPEALDVIENYYGYLLDSGATTWGEHFDAINYPSASLSHVWGGSPTWFLSTYVLGARWEAPGKWSLRPAFSGVTRAAGSIPLDSGLLIVEWERLTCNQGFIKISSPTKSGGVVSIPVREPILHVELDGSVVWGKSAPSHPDISQSLEGLDIPLTGGNHSVSIQFDC
ncbi:MAG: alpha-L-rhamnosidase-related protein [Anaerolineales bacterium]